MDKKYLIVLPIEPFSPGDAFQKCSPLPLHCTVMPWFQIGERSSFAEMNSHLDIIALMPEYGRIQLISKKPALYGTHKSVGVHVLEYSEQLILLHNSLLWILVGLRMAPERFKWMGAGWRPHVTDVSESGNERSFLPGTVHIPDSLVVIEKDPTGCKTVVADYQFV